MTITNNELLEFALFGLEQQRQHVESKIAELKEQLGNGARRGPGRPAKNAHHVPEAISTTAATTDTKAKKPMSIASRKRIAAAQKKRWAAYREAQSAAS